MDNSRTRYMPLALSQGQRLSYAWDDWDTDAYFRHLPPRLISRVNHLTNKANLCLTLATSEWGIYSLMLHTDITLALQYVEAAWAASIHSRYFARVEFDDDYWRGPVRGPIYLFMLIIDDALHALSSDPRIASRACWAFNLVNYILQDARPFLDWWDSCLGRVEQFHTEAVELAGLAQPDIFDDFQNQGMPVPQEAFDPAYNYRPDDTPKLLDRFLRSLDPSANQFLVLGEQLAGVDGGPADPYRYLPDHRA